MKLVIRQKLVQHSKINSLICFCNNFSTSTLTLNSVPEDTTPQTASKLHWNTTDHTSMTVGTCCYYEISSTHLHKRKQILQKLSCTLVCAATKPCRFELLAKCSHGITLLAHSLFLQFLQVFSVSLQHATPLSSELHLLCLFVIFRSTFFFQFQLTPHREHSLYQLLFLAQLFSSASAHISYRTQSVSIIKNDINVQIFSHEVPIISVPFSSNLNVVWYVGKTTS